jgi:oxygen-independent coproporphyrinogen-3 oxidase
VRKCPYCDFNSHAVKDEIPEQAYVKALLNDLQLEQAAAQGRSIETIFIGGGTPSLFTAQAIGQILEGANRIIPFSSNVEITMEANPGTFEQERFAGFKAAGVTRLSVGVQSFNQQHLQKLGRIHSGEEAKKAILAAQSIGFEHLNIDLMHGLPDQTAEQAIDDLNTAIALQPDHLSWYQLTIEPNTEFFAKPPVIPEDDILWGIQEAGQSILAKAGFKQYEVSAYSINEASRAKHNLNYWQFGDYIGIGAGAHGKLTFPEQNLIQRRWKQRSPKSYLQSIHPLGGEQSVLPEDRTFEFMMNALRLIDGVPFEQYQQRTLLDPALYLQQPLNDAIRRQLMVDSSAQLQATPQGYLFLNDLSETFI